MGILHYQTFTQPNTLQTKEEENKPGQNNILSISLKLWTKHKKSCTLKAWPKKIKKISTTRKLHLDYTRQSLSVTSYMPSPSLCQENRGEQRQPTPGMHVLQSGLHGGRDHHLHATQQFVWEWLNSSHSHKCTCRVRPTYLTGHSTLEVEFIMKGRLSRPHTLKYFHANLQTCTVSESMYLFSTVYHTRDPYSLRYSPLCVDF